MSVESFFELVKLREEQNIVDMQGKARPAPSPAIAEEEDADVVAPEYIGKQVQKSIDDIKRRMLETEDLKRCKAYSEDLICVQKNALQQEQKEKDDIRHELQIANEAIAQRTRLAVEGMKRAEIAEKKAELAMREAEELRGHLKALMGALSYSDVAASKTDAIKTDYTKADTATTGPTKSDSTRAA